MLVLMKEFAGVSRLPMIINDIDESLMLSHHSNQAIGV